MALESIKRSRRDLDEDLDCVLEEMKSVPVEDGMCQPVSFLRIKLM